MSANDSTVPVGGNRWVSVGTLDGTNDIVTLVSGSTDIEVHEIVASMTSGATTAAKVPYTVERVTPAQDLLAAGTLMQNIGSHVFEFDVGAQSVGLRIRAGTVTNSGVGRICIYWSYKGGDTPSTV